MENKIKRKMGAGVTYGPKNLSSGPRTSGNGVSG